MLPISVSSFLSTIISEYKVHRALGPAPSGIRLHLGDLGSCLASCTSPNLAFEIGEMIFHNESGFQATCSRQIPSFKFIRMYNDWWNGCWLSEFMNHATLDNTRELSGYLCRE